MFHIRALYSTLYFSILVLYVLQSAADLILFGAFWYQEVLLEDFFALDVAKNVQKKPVMLMIYK